MSRPGTAGLLRPFSVFTPAAMPGAGFVAMNSAAVSGAMPTFTDPVSGRVMTGHGTSATQAYGRHFEQNMQPVLNVSSTLAQYYSDDAAGAAAFADQFRLAGHYAVGRVDLRNGSADAIDPLIGTSNDGTSNANAFGFYFTGTQITFWVTSITAGGTAHIFAQTAAGAIKYGDVFDFAFVHNTNKTWTLAIVRQARTTSDNGGLPTTITLSGSYASTIDLTQGLNPLVIGATPALGHFGSWSLHSLVLGAVQGTTVATDIPAYLAWERGLCNFAFVAYDQNGVVVYPTNYNDTIHLNDSGQAIQAAAGGAAERAAVAAAGRAGALKVTVGISDSRGTGTGASGVAAYWQTVMDGQAFPYGRSDVGPKLNMAGAPCFSVSGACTRTNGAQHGWSPLTPDTFTLNNYFPAQGYDDTDVFHVFLGVNDMVSVQGYDRLDMVDALFGCVDFLRANLTRPPIVVLYEEPVTGTTTSGGIQQQIRARNRAYHCGVRYLRGLGLTVQFVQMNDQTYFPS